MSGSEGMEKTNMTEKTRASEVMRAVGELEPRFLEEAQELRSGRALAERRARIARATRVLGGLAAAALLFVVVGIAVPRMLSKEQSATAPASTDSYSPAAETAGIAEEAAEAPMYDAEENWSKGAAESEAEAAEAPAYDGAGLETDNAAQALMPNATGDASRDAMETPAEAVAPAEAEAPASAQAPYLLVLLTEDQAQAGDTLFAGLEWTVKTGDGERMTQVVDTAGVFDTIREAAARGDAAGIVPADVPLFADFGTYDLPDAMTLRAWPAEAVLDGTARESEPAFVTELTGVQLPELPAGMVYELTAVWEESLCEERGYAGAAIFCFRTR